MIRSKRPSVSLVAVNRSILPLVGCAIVLAACIDKPDPVSESGEQTDRAKPLPVTKELESVPDPKPETFLLFGSTGRQVLSGVEVQLHQGQARAAMQSHRGRV